MKVGDLVRWTHPEFEDIGVIRALLPGALSDMDHALIHWFKDPDCDGPYPTDHHLLEVVERKGENEV
mgnify:FL=1